MEEGEMRRRSFNRSLAGFAGGIGMLGTGSEYEKQISDLTNVLLEAGLPPTPQGPVQTLGEDSSVQLLPRAIQYVDSHVYDSGVAVENTSWEVDGALRSRGARNRQAFGVVMGSAFEAPARGVEARINLDVEYDVGAYINGWRPERAVETDKTDVSTSSSPDEWLTIDLGTDRLLRGINQQVRNAAHAGLSVGYFLQNLTTGKVVVQIPSGGIPDDIFNVTQNGDGRKQGSTFRRDRITVPSLFEGETYRLGVAVGGSVGSSTLWRGDISTFSCELTKIEVEAVDV